MINYYMFKSGCYYGKFEAKRSPVSFKSCHEQTRTDGGLD